ncbi:MAG TPA: hypothetical protein VJ528_08205 [Geothrix sp.]|uniref:hypothetical protein n=1 Tax=Geothrix mesophila TaxID=2922723 RepID=UPI001FAB64F5|nr:hypothetical protein [Geothrix sp. SG198]HJV38804.1 hypothetical protein [Geothrix sp.]
MHTYFEITATWPKDIKEMQELAALAKREPGLNHSHMGLIKLSTVLLRREEDHPSPWRERALVPSFGSSLLRREEP